MITLYDEIHPIYMNQEDRTIAMWVRIKVELEAGSKWFWRGRWWTEVSCQWVHPSGNPVTRDGEWYHYWKDDYSTFTLRRAWLKVDQVVDELIERMNNDPGERPI